MRLRVGAVLCLFLAFLGMGCRRALAPTTDNDLAPETWITAAPQDTITTKDAGGIPTAPTIGRIPVRFHLYWAGSDRDGAVAGFYWAVVETLATPPPGDTQIPFLPGPKARDYHFTTRTDSVFIFDASEDVPERQHAFFIYAVDNKGKADPTPARFVFSSYDRFPPIVAFDTSRTVTACQGVGTTYQLLPGGGVTPTQTVAYMSHSFDRTLFAPIDTVPSNSVLTFRWRGIPTNPSMPVASYRYKLDEPDFNSVDSSVHMATYNTGVNGNVVAPGQKIFTARAVDPSGWRGEANLWFQMNFAPDTWFAGPNLSDPLEGWQHFNDLNNHSYYFLTFPNATVTGTTMSSDSLNVLPALRPPRKTFYEIYGGKLWYHQEGDTVSMNAWVVIPAGGFDRDSPYNVLVNPNAPSASPVTTRTGPNGSPVAFQGKVQVRPGTDPLAIPTSPSYSTPFPDFNPASVTYLPTVNGYFSVNTAGRAYAVLKAKDGDGALDGRVDAQPGGAPGIADRVDGLSGTPSAVDIALRSKILTFYVDHAPVLNTRASTPPSPGGIITSASPTFKLAVTDPDPYDVEQDGGKSPGGPGTQVLRILVQLRGKDAAGNLVVSSDTTTVFPASQVRPTLPPNMKNGPITLRVELCDCTVCEVRFGHPDIGAGNGRCVMTDMNYTLNVPGHDPASLGGPTSEAQRPGSTSDVGRRQ